GARRKRPSSARPGECLFVTPDRALGWRAINIPSPRARGLPRGRRARVLRARSIPACAGFTAPERCCASTATVHPRVRGAYPEAVEHASYVLGPSPRARGTTSVTWHLTNDKQLFLQLLENPTNQTHHAQRSTLATKYTTHPEAPLPTPARLGHHSGSVR